jgi:hypothetical protein
MTHTLTDSLTLWGLWPLGCPVCSAPSHGSRDSDTGEKEEEKKEVETIRNNSRREDKIRASNENRAWGFS